MAKLKINGVEKDFQDALPATVEDLLKTMNIIAATIVAEIDGNIIESKDFHDTTLKADQNIELIKFVPGG